MMNTRMSNLTGIAIRSEFDTSVCKDTTSQTRTQCDDNKVTHTMSTTESMFAQCHHMGIISHSHSQSQSVAQQGRQWDNTLPGEVRRIHDTSQFIVCTWCTDTHGTDGLKSSIRFYQLNDSITQSRHISPNLRIILSGEAVLCQNVSSNIHNGIRCCVQTNVYTYNSFLYGSFIHSYLFSYSATKIETF